MTLLDLLGLVYLSLSFQLVTSTPEVQVKSIHIPTGYEVAGPVCWRHENPKYKYQALCTKFTETYYVYSDKKKLKKKHLKSRTK